MLADGGRAPAERRPGTVEGDGQAHQLEAMLGRLLDHADGLGLRVGQDLVQRVHRRAGTPTDSRRSTHSPLVAVNMIVSIIGTQHSRVFTARGSSNRWIARPPGCPSTSAQLGEKLIIAGGDDGTGPRVEALEDHEPPAPRTMPRR